MMNAYILFGKGVGKEVSWNALNKAWQWGRWGVGQWTCAVLWLPLMDTLGNILYLDSSGECFWF